MSDPITEALGRYMDAIEARLAKVEASIPARVQAERETLLEAVKASLPQPVSGPPGPPGRDGVDGAPGEPGVPGERGEAGPAGERGPQGEKGADGLPGARGEPGVPGEAGARGPRGERGIDGRDGKDGRDGVATTDQLTTLIADGIEARLAAVVEARVTAELANWPKPEYRHVWTPDAEYREGNLATWGGSLWICNATGTKEQPGERSADWSLCAKRGRDGRDR